MLTNKTQIEAIVRDEWDNLENSSYPEDILSELADAEIPVYTREIIDEWQDMPIDYRDEWREYGANDGNKTITELMAIDLYAYYSSEFTLSYEAIRAAMEEAGDE